MKRTEIERIDTPLPKEIEMLCANAKVYDSSCSAEARVYFIDKDDGYFLKISAKDTLRTEAEMTEYFSKRGFCNGVLSYLSEEKDFLITKRVLGEDATHERFLSDPKKLCDSLAEYLRELHEVDFSDSPVKNRNESYAALVKKNYESGYFDLSLTEEIYKFESAREAYDIFENGKSEFKSDVLLHGDYCLPNVILNEDFSLSGFIDLGNGGVGDRHIDLFWGTWTLLFNLKTDEYRSRFIDAYGRDKANEEMLRVIAAAEAFG